MSEKRKRRWLPVVVVAVVAALAAGVFVASSNGDSEPSGNADSGDSESTSAGASPAAGVGERLAQADLPEPVASVDGSVLTIPGGVAKPAVAEILAVESDGRGTLLTWRLRSAGGTLDLDNRTLATKQSRFIDGASAGVVLATAGEVLRPLASPTKQLDCICSLAPLHLGEEGQVLTGLYPDVPTGTTSIEVRIPGFPGVPEVPVTRLDPGDRAQAGRVVEATDGVPVEGVFQIAQSSDNGAPLASGAIHGVRRVSGATIVYFSVGYPPDVAGHPTVLFLQPLPTQGRWIGANNFVADAIDPIGRKKYTPLVDAQKRCLCSTFLNAENDKPGKYFVFYSVLPELPDEVDFVDVQLGFGTVVRGVPVQAGALSPPAPADAPIELGQGWPAVDPDAIAAAPGKDLSIEPLASRIENPTGDVITQEQPDQLSVDLATDVLFDVDSAVLGPEAQDRIKTAAEVINARASGPVSIVGHTDNTGGTAHNEQLSLARAQAVQAALQPLITAPGVTFTTEGHGEREPIADNASEDGRRVNRRVSVTFVPKDR